MRKCLSTNPLFKHTSTPKTDAFMGILQFCNQFNTDLADIAFCYIVWHSKSQMQTKGSSFFLMMRGLWE